MKYASQHDGKAFILKAEDDSKVRVGPRHEKYGYVQGVEASRVIGISKSRSMPGALMGRSIKLGTIPMV